MKQQGSISSHPNDPDGRLHAKLDIIIALLKLNLKTCKGKGTLKHGK